jgi:hypothetical protein
MEKDMRTKCQRPFSKTKMQTLRVRDSTRVKGEKNKEKEKKFVVLCCKEKAEKKNSSWSSVGRSLQKNVHYNVKNMYSKTFRSVQFFSFFLSWSCRDELIKIPLSVENWAMKIFMILECNAIPFRSLCYSTRESISHR